jgi:hypothetical protein
MWGWTVKRRKWGHKPLADAAILRHTITLVAAVIPIAVYHAAAIVPSYPIPSNNDANFSALSSTLSATTLPAAVLSDIILAAVTIYAVISGPHSRVSRAASNHGVTLAAITISAIISGPHTWVGRAASNNSGCAAISSTAAFTHAGFNFTAIICSNSGEAFLSATTKNA